MFHLLRGSYLTSGEFGEDAVFVPGEFGFVSEFVGPDNGTDFGVGVPDTGFFTETLFEERPCFFCSNPGAFDGDEGMKGCSENFVDGGVTFGEAGKTARVREDPGVYFGIGTGAGIGVRVPGATDGEFHAGTTVVGSAGKSHLADFRIKLCEVDVVRGEVYVLCGHGIRRGEICTGYKVHPHFLYFWERGVSEYCVVLFLAGWIVEVFNIGER